MATKIYHIEGILNPIEWDGVNPPRPLRLRQKGYVTLQKRKGRRRGFYHIRTAEKKEVEVGVGALTFMLRHRVTPAQYREHRIYTLADGSLYDRKQACKSRSFPSIEELEETVRIIKAAKEGRYQPMYAYAREHREEIFRGACFLYYMNPASIDLLYEEAVETVFRQFAELRVYSIRRVRNYILSALKTLWSRRADRVPYRVKAAMQ